MSLSLTYFDVRGRGETIRLILAYAGVQYQDIRMPIGSETFTLLKPSLRYGQLPRLTIGDEELYQSMAIARYLAREHRLVGGNNLENAQVDEVVDTICDLENAAYTALFTKDPAAKDEKLGEVLGTKVPETLLRLEKLLTSRGGQFFAGNCLTWADLHFLHFVDQAIGISNNDQLLEPVPKLKSSVSRVRALPNIAKWLENRPKSEF